MIYVLVAYTVLFMRCISVLSKVLSLGPCKHYQSAADELDVAIVD